MPREKKGKQKHRHPDIYLGKKASGMVTISSPGIHTHTALQQPQHHHSKHCLHEVTHFHPKENRPPLSSSSHSETSSSSSSSSSRPYGRDSSKLKLLGFLIFTVHRTQNSPCNEKSSQTNKLNAKRPKRLACLFSSVDGN